MSDVLTTPWRYPGGKRRLAPALAQFTDQHIGEPWVEPFVGGGGFVSIIGSGLFRRGLVLADYDGRVAAWWQVVADSDSTDYDALLERLIETVPTVEMHTELQACEQMSRLDMAFAGIVLNRTSFSGIAMGGPIGGKDQKSDYPVGCRFNTDRLIVQHGNIRRAVIGATVLCADFQVTLAHRGLAVCDPPYVAMGRKLYPHSFTVEDHERLAACLLGRNDPFVLTYDDDDLVRDLYASCTITEIPARYSINGVKVGWDNKTELVVTP